MLLLILLLFRLNVSLLKLDKQYLFNKPQNLTFHCGLHINQKTSILIRSNTRFSLSETNIIQVGSQDEKYMYLALFIAEQCLSRMSIKCEGKFSIVQKIYAPIELSITQKSLMFSNKYHNSFTFSIDEEQLIIIELSNYSHQIDSFRLILMLKTEDAQIEQNIDQADFHMYFKLLAVGQYELFILGNLIYRINFQIEQVSDNFIFSNSDIKNIQNLTLVNSGPSSSKLYLIVQRGYCEIIAQSKIFPLEQSITMELKQHNIYLFIAELLEIIMKAQPLIIYVRQVHIQVILYPTTLILIYLHIEPILYLAAKNNIQMSSKDHVLIEYSQSENNYNVRIQLDKFGIYEFEIQFGLYQISYLDVVYISIYKNTTVEYICDLREYSFERLSGRFDYLIKNQSLTIASQTFTTLIFRKTFIDWIELQLETVYKFDSSNRFRIQGSNPIFFKIETFPEIKIYAYKDHQSAINGQIADQIKQLRFNHAYYTYIIAISDQPFYIIVYDVSVWLINLPKIVIPNELIISYGVIQNLQIISPQKSVQVIISGDSFLIKYEFDQQNNHIHIYQKIFFTVLSS